MMENQEDYSFIRENCNESKMFRNNYLSNLTLRDAVDNAFLGLLTLYIFNKEFETAPFAQNYARRTMMFGSFREPRVAGTDLYQALHLATNPTGKTAGKLDGTEQNAVLATRLHVKEKMAKDFLRGLASGTLDRATAIRLMFRLEPQMNIDISNYKSLRRLITDWENLTTFQRQICITRLLQYYRTRGRRSDLYPMLETLAKAKGWEIKDVENAEVAAIGAAGAFAASRTSSGTLSTIAKVGGAAAAGWALGKFFTTPTKQ
jgi:hypothetical protein